MTKKALEIRDKTIFDGIFVKYILKFIYAVWFKLAGWKTTGSAPDGAGITIAAPHTSNWDIVYALGAAILLDVKIYFSIKDSWCKVPVIGRIMLWMGAIPINRSSKGQGQVELIRNFVERHKDSRIFFLFTPEGTRGEVDRWKTGFYHIAEECQLPIFLAKVDYRTKVSGVFHSYQLTDSKDADIEAIQESYKSVYGKFPALQYPAYSGPLPDISQREMVVMFAVHSFKGFATQAEIAARTKFEEVNAEMLEFLVEKGILEKIDEGKKAIAYKMTSAGKGFLLHLAPTLAQPHK